MKIIVITLLGIISYQLQTIILHIEGARLDWLDTVPECVITEQPVKPAPSPKQEETYHL